MSQTTVVTAHETHPFTGVHVPTTLHLREPLPGLPGHVEFDVTSLDDIGVLHAIRSVPSGADAAQTPVRLFVVVPQPFFADYAPRISAEAVAAVGGHAERLVLLVVVHPADGTNPATANLLAPLVVDPVTGATVQTVVDEDWPLRAPLG
jgi:flagellar assembly factor FliW